ncbi:hypothetical protein [Acidocella sp.]|uniref:hypothetical protein n=1 Tax=Acidocella sp. TaxID=50710 RepID=UPI00263452FA|nr:hypothetical protein [Acidocella sp.]
MARGAKPDKKRVMPLSPQHSDFNIFSRASEIAAQPGNTRPDKQNQKTAGTLVFNRIGDIAMPGAMRRLALTKI